MTPVTGTVPATADSTAAAAAAPRAHPLAPRRTVTMGLLAALLVIVVAFPFVFSNPAVTSVAFFTLLFVGTSSAWNLFSGYTGYMALGNAVFFGSGAYFFAIIVVHLKLAAGVGLFAYLPLAGLFAALVALPVGWLALRTRRHTFVVITIAIFFIFQLLAFNLTALTNGSSGMQLPFPPWDAATYNDYFYMAALVVAILAVGMSWVVRSSSFGLQLLAIRDDEDRARGLGVQTARVKLLTFALSAFLTGMCGGIYAYYLGSIYPPFAFEAIFDLTVALMAFLGGLGTVSGPVVGALILEPLQQYLTLRFTGGGLSLIMFGVLFLVVIRFMPEGIVPSVAGVLRRRHDAAGRPDAASTHGVVASADAVGGGAAQ